MRRRSSFAVRRTAQRWLSSTPPVRLSRRATGSREESSSSGGEQRATVQWRHRSIGEVAMKAWIVIGCFAAGAALAQEGPRFEVASVKPHSAEAGMNAMPQALVRMMAMRGCVLPKNTPGRWQSNGMPLSYLVACAYGVKPFQVTAAPWMESEGYDIVAKMPADTDEAQFRLMLRNLLAERFHLA